MERYVTILAALVLAANLSTSASAEDMEVTVFGEMESAYILSTGTTVSDDPVAQGGITFAKDGFWIEPWVSVGLNNDNGNEFDLIVGYTHELSGTSTLIVKGGYFDLGPDVDVTETDAIYVGVKMIHDMWSFELDTIRPDAAPHALLMDVDRKLANGFAIGTTFGQEPFSGEEIVTFRPSWTKSIGDNGYLKVGANYRAVGDTSDDRLKFTVSIGGSFAFNH